METPSRREFLLTAAAGTAAFLAGNISTQSTGTQDRVRDVFTSPNDLEVQDSDYARAIEQVRHSVFKIRGPNGHGSGFLLRDGFILTNQHVTADNAFHMNVRESPMALPNFTQFPIPSFHNISAVQDASWEAQCFSDDDRQPGATFRVSPVILSDGSRANHKDLSLLRMPPDGRSRLPADMRPVEIGTPRVGQASIILGSPFDLLSHVGHGRVSRSVIMPPDGHGNERWTNVPFVGSDAPLNSGNSGGAMFSLRRQRGQNGRPELKTELIGVPTFGARWTHGLGGSIRADYLAFIASTKWGLPILSPSQIEQYRRDFPTVE